ncbi:MAG TPA: ChbG/HpnK family deacetylase [Thermoanaerobaculia bacterium]|nr:ChbG/HpnK family deacetylase [Thermoanaerobaculia bacterium]
MIRLVLTADDAGLAAPLSLRIASLLASGRLSATSLLACAPAFDDAAEALRAAGVTEAGVHLCVVGGETPRSPLSAVPSLAPGGRFPHSWPVVAARIAAGRARIPEVEREWEAQLVAVKDAGFRVTHLDSHQHLHLLPKLLPVALALARRFDVPFVRAPHANDPAGIGAPIGPAARARTQLLSLFGAAARRRIAAALLPEPPRVLGLAEAGRMTISHWASLVPQLPDAGTFEVVLHPGADDPDARARYPWGYAWEDEARALESEDLAALFASHGVETVSFWRLAAG